MIKFDLHAHNQLLQRLLWSLSQWCSCTPTAWGYVFKWLLHHFNVVRDEECLQNDSWPSSQVLGLLTELPNHMPVGFFGNPFSKTFPMTFVARCRYQVIVNILHCHLEFFQSRIIKFINEHLESTHSVNGIPPFKKSKNQHEWDWDDLSGNDNIVIIWDWECFAQGVVCIHDQISIWTKPCFCFLEVFIFILIIGGKDLLSMLSLRNATISP